MSALSILTGGVAGLAAEAATPQAPRPAAPPAVPRRDGAAAEAARRASLLANRERGRRATILSDPGDRPRGVATGKSLLGQ
ncbi:MAG: hypothetical protein ACFB6R_07435 [Alphaproteobacteria bacterium]